MDRPHRQHVFEGAKTPFDLGQLLVHRHRVLGGEVLLAGGHDVLPLQPLFACQLHRMLEELERPVAESPVVIAIPAMRPQRPPGRCADLFWRGELPFRDASPHAFQLDAGPLHRLLAFALLVGATLVGVDHEHPLPGIVAGHFLHARPRRIGALSGVHTHRAINPLTIVQGLQPAVQSRIPATLQPNQIAVPAFLKRSQIVLADHPPVPHEHDPPERKTPRQVLDRRLHRGRVDAIPLPHVMRDRPTAHHHQPHDHLHVSRLAVAAVAVPGELRRPRPFKVRARDVVQNQVRPKAEQIPKPLVQPQLQRLLRRQQPIQRAIPSVQLLMMHTHPPPPTPTRHKPTPPPIAHEVGLQPVGQAVLALRANQPIGHEHERPIRVGDVRPRRAQKLVEHLPQPQLVEQRPHHQHRPPGRRLENLHVVTLPFDLGQPLEHAFQLGQQLLEEILASQVGDRPLLDLAVFTVGLDDADVLVDLAAGGRDFDGADEHGR